MILDEAALAVVRARQPKALPHLAERTANEMAEASALFDEHGWSANPVAYHRRPPPLAEDDVTTLATYAWPRRHECVVFSSGFAPRGIEPAADRWAHDCNDIVYVRVRRHPGPARPWVVCLHGFGMGTSRFDLSLLWANHFHNNLGFNVAVPVLPFHGARKSPTSGELLSLDLAMTIHGITQAIWDIRRLVQWIRQMGGATVGVYGLSLGGYLAALIGAIEPVEGVVAGIPIADVLGLMAYHRAPEEYTQTLHSAAARNAFRVVSPLALAPEAAACPRALFIGRGDRLIPPDQSAALADAWFGSPVHYYRGGHTGYLWSRATKAFATGFLRDAL